MSSPESPPSIFGTDADPRADTALSPWVWLPLTFLTVVCVLFVSLRRAHALELYDRGLAWLHAKSPFLSSSPSSHGHIRLHPQDLEALRPSLSGNESDSEDGDSPSCRDEVDTSDELPQPYAYAPRARVLAAGGKMKQLASGALDTLGWGAEGRGAFAAGARNGDKDAGIARAFWGTRQSERAGGIKLGASGSGPTPLIRQQQGGLSGFGGLLERVTDVAGSRLPPSSAYAYSNPPPISPRRAPPAPSSRSSSRRSSVVDVGLFELGEEDGNEGAVELPREFELSDPLSAGRADSIHAPSAKTESAPALSSSPAVQLAPLFAFQSRPATSGFFTANTTRICAHRTFWPRVLRDRTALLRLMLSALWSCVAPVARIPPSSWNPSSPLPAGSYTRLLDRKCRITEQSKLTVQAEGSWAHGTLAFESRRQTAVGNGEGSSSTAAAGGGDLPSYDQAVRNLEVVQRARTAAQEKAEGGQLAEGEGELLVQIEARWNDEKLWEESEVSLEARWDEIVLLVKTPNTSPGRLTSQLSFHVTLVFPAALSSLGALTTSASQWRHVGASSFKSLLIHQAHLSTTNAPLSFTHLRAGEMKLSSCNAEISGRFEAEEKVEVSAQNTIISGHFSTPGAASITTSNRLFAAEVSAEELTVRNQNSKIQGSFKAGRHLDLETSNNAIEWTSMNIRRSNGVLRLKTVNAPIKGRIGLVEEGGAHSCLPSKDKKGALSTTTTGAFHGSARTANRDVDLRFEAEGGGLFASSGLFNFEASSPNGKVVVEVPAPWNSHFSASTSNAQAIVEAPSDHDIVYNKQEKTKIDGWVGQEGEPRSESKISLSSSNRLVVLKVV